MAGFRAKRRGLFLAAAVAGLAALGAWAAFAMAGENVTAEDVCCQFTKSTYSSGQGETAQFINPAGGEDSPHNVTAKLKGPDGKPQFRSKTAATYLPSGD